jgi:hypothetical protein
VTKTQAILDACARRTVRLPAWAKGKQVHLDHGRASDRDAYLIHAYRGEPGDGRCVWGVAAIDGEDAGRIVARWGLDPDEKIVDGMVALFDRALVEALRKVGVRPPMPEHEKRWRKARCERMTWKRRLAA